MEPSEEALAGGVANAGAVVRVGDHVLRPRSPYTESIHAYLGALHDAGFQGASRPLGVDPDGRERLVFIEGDVATPPYPDWVQTDEALASTASLLAAMHVAARGFDGSALPWSPELADRAGGVVVCHNDVCPENVVFRDGIAVGLIDFEFAAPGRPVFDLAALVRMWVPIDDDVNATRLGWGAVDRPSRLAIAVDAYGLAESARSELMECLDATIAYGGAFVQRRVEAGDPNFTAMYEAMGGARRFERRRQWWSAHRAAFCVALGLPPTA